MKEELKVIYEDNHILIVIKPQNVLSQGDETGDESMIDAVKAYLKEKYNKPGNVYVGLVHRLDRPTGGIMVFAKTSKAAERLSSAIANGGFEKQYLAVVVGTLRDKQATLLHYLEKNASTNVVQALTYKKDGAKEAKLSYRTISVKENLNLIEVHLYTGRSHQIRVQMATVGTPVFGDAKYGGDKLAKGWNMALWAYKLSFEHPTTKQAMVFVVYPPLEDLPWKMFLKEVEKLK